MFSLLYLSHVVQALWLLCQAPPFTLGIASWLLTSAQVLCFHPRGFHTLWDYPLPLTRIPSIPLPPCSPSWDLDHWFPPVQWSLHNTTPAGWVCTRDCPCIASGRCHQWSKRKRDRHLCPSTGEQVTQDWIRSAISWGAKILSNLSSCPMHGNV